MAVEGEEGGVMARNRNMIQSVCFTARTGPSPSFPAIWCRCRSCSSSSKEPPSCRAASVKKGFRLSTTRKKPEETQRVSERLSNHSFPSFTICWWMSFSFSTISFISSSRCLYSPLSATLLAYPYYELPDILVPTIDMKESTTDVNDCFRASLSTCYSVTWNYNARTSR